MGNNERERRLALLERKIKIIFVIAQKFYKSRENFIFCIEHGFITMAENVIKKNLYTQIRDINECCNY